LNGPLTLGVNAEYFGLTGGFMKKAICCFAVLSAVVVFSGCSTGKNVAAGMYGLETAMYSRAASPMNDAVSTTDRMLAWTANLEVEVDNVSNTVEQICAQVKAVNGFVDNQSAKGEVSASMRIRQSRSRL